MVYVVIGLIVVICVLLVVVVLAQNSKGGGLNSSFGGSSTANMIGVKRTGDLLENLTWGFAGALMVLAVSSAFIMNTAPEQEVYESPNIDAARGAGGMNPLGPQPQNNNMGETESLEEEGTIPEGEEGGIGDEDASEIEQGTPKPEEGEEE